MLDIAVACVRKMRPGDLEQVLAWRNHPDVRRYMYTRHEISPEEHQRWFEHAAADPARHLLVFEMSGIACGVIHFHQYKSAAIADWGFYLAPDAQKGVGGMLGKAALHYAFDDMRWHKVCGEALAFNERSLRFHRRLGFLQEGVRRQQCFDGQHYHDVVCFGLLREEWLQEP